MILIDSSNPQRSLINDLPRWTHPRQTASFSPLHCSTKCSSLLMQAESCSSIHVRKTKHQHKIHKIGTVLPTGHGASKVAVTLWDHLIASGKCRSHLFKFDLQMHDSLLARFVPHLKSFTRRLLCVSPPSSTRSFPQVLFVNQTDVQWFKDRWTSAALSEFVCKSI